MQEQFGFPACFSSPIEKVAGDAAAITRSGQNVFISVYRTKIAGQCRLITVTWCKNLLLHGLSVSVEDSQSHGDSNQPHACKVEIKPWHFWKKNGSKRFVVDGQTPVDVFWDLRFARFNGEAEPGTAYYVAVVCCGEVVLLLGNMKNEAYRKTGCGPSLMDPILVSRKEHVFGKRKFSTKARFHDKGSLHEISIECMGKASDGEEPVPVPVMEIRMDGHLVIRVKQLQWKFRGNEMINLKRGKIEVYYDVHDWLFIPGLRHALFIFKPISWPASSSNADFCLFLYAWKVE